MLRISKPARNNIAVLLLAGVTVLTGAGAIKNANKDYNKYKAETTLSEENKANTNPISDETKAYATMFSLGLLGTGIAVNNKRKNDKYNASLNKVLSGMDFKTKFETPNTIKLVDINGTPISNSSYTLEGYSKEQIMEIITITFSEDFKAKNITKEDLEKAEVIEFQEEIRNAVKYSRKGISTRLQKEDGINSFAASSDSIDLYRVSESLPKEVKDEYLDLYREKGRRHFFYSDCTLIDPIKLQEALLEKHGIKLEVIMPSNNKVLDSDESSTDEESSDDFDTIIVTDKNGDKMEIKNNFYHVDTLIDLTKKLHSNNWLCK